MAIKSESDGTWTVSYHKRHPLTNQPVSRRRIKLKSKLEAQRVFNTLVVEVDGILKRSVVPNWLDFLAVYFASLELEDITETTKYNRRKLLLFYTSAKWGAKLIDEIKESDILLLMREELGPRAESYQKFVFKCLRGAFNFAVSRGLISKNPMPLLKFKISRKIKSVLNEPQILKLLRCAQENEFEWYPHYAMALFTGMRNGELYALRWENISLERRTIVVNSSWNLKDGYKSTKSGDDRVIEIALPLLALLRDLKLNSQGSEFVLPKLPRWSRGEQAHDLRLYLKSVGLPEVRFHDLRASWATWLLDKGVAASKVMSQGGWTNLDTMMIYMRKAGIEVRGSTQVLDEFTVHGAKTNVIELNKKF
jgi:integrase